MKAQISVTVKTVPHPDPQRLIDLWAQIVLRELLRREAEGDENDSRGA